MRFGIFLFSILLASAFGFSGDFEYYESVAVFLIAYFLLDFIYSFAQQLKVLDIIILFSLFQCMLMPIVIFNIYNDDYYVKALKYNMSVSKDEYFSYMLPAMLALIAGIRFPLGAHLDKKEKYETLITKLKEYLSDKETLGKILIFGGFAFGILEPFVPSILSYFLFLFSKLIYVGILYVYFSSSPTRNLYLAAGLILALLQSISSGLFGDLIYLSVLSLMVLFLGKDIKFSRKLAISIAGILCVILIQSVKSEFRRQTWYGAEDVNKTSAFFDVTQQKLLNADELITKEGAFPIIVRFNQGMIVSKVMDYIPFSAPYADGETIWMSMAASFVPRYIWPDKPLAGGKQNMLRFTGILIEGYSMNVGPFGEAYGNFGKNGGIIYMFFYGLFFNFIFVQILKRSQKTPTLILWVPYLFINSIQIETDTLLTVNSIIKGGLFVWFCFWLFRRTVGISL